MPLAVRALVTTAAMLFLGWPPPRPARMTQVFHDSEIELAAIDVDVCDLYPNELSQTKPVAAARSGQAVRRAVIAIEVVVECIDVY